MNQVSAQTTSFNMTKTGSVIAGTVAEVGSQSATFTIIYKVNSVETNAPETYTFTVSSIHQSGTAIFSPSSTITLAAGTSSVTFFYNNTKVGGTGVSDTHEITYTRTSGTAVTTGNTGTATTTVTANSPYTVLLSGPSTMAATSSVTLTLTLNDKNGNLTNAVGNTTFTISTTDSPGTATITTSPATINNGTSTTTFTYENSTVGDGTHLITATRGGGDALVNASDNRSITVTPGARNKIIISSVTPSVNPIAGTAATVTAQVTDVFNNPVSDNTITINWSKDNTNVTLSDVGGTTDATGKRTVNATTPTTVTTTIITATEGGGVGLGTATQTITSVAGSAYSMAFHAGNTQTATVNSAVTTKPAVIIKDANNNVKSGVTVTFTTSNLGGSVSHATTTTNAAGIASTTWTLGTVAGPQTLTAASTGLTNVTFSAVASAGDANKLVVTAPNLSPSPGSSQIISAQVADFYGNAVASSTLSVSWTKDNANGTLSPLTSTTNASGIATTTFTAHSVSGTVTSITAAAGGLTSGTSSPTTVATVGAASTLSIFQAPFAGNASGAVLTTQPVIYIRDNSGNLVTSATNLVTVAISSGTGGTVSGTTSVSAVGGIATFTNLTLAGVVGTNYQLTFSAAGLTSATSGSLTVTFGIANKLAVSTAPVAGSSGSALTTQPVIHIQDAQGNLVTNNTSQVGISIIAGSGGTLAGTIVVSAVGGVATFSGITLTGTPGSSYTLGFTSTPTLTTTSHVVTLGAGSASQLFVSQAPVAGVSGVIFPTQPVIQIRDSGGTLVSTATHTVQVSSSSGTLGGTTLVTAVGGVATFTNLSLAGTPGASFTLTFTSTPPLTTVTSTVTLTTTAGTATKLAITTQPVGAANQAVLAAQPVIEIQDANGLRVTTATNTVTVTVTPSSSGSLGGTLSVPAVNGVATFSGLTLSGLVGTNYTLSFASGSLTLATSNAVTLTGPAAASKLAIDRQPVGGVSNELLPTQPIIHIQDAQGNRVTSSSATVTAALLAGSSSGTLGGAKDAIASNGVASFTNLFIEGPSTVSYTIQFTSGSLTSVTSNSINLSSLPTVSTATVTAITSSSATLGGNVTNQGTSALIQKGVCYSTTANPTLNTSGSTCLVSAGTSTGAFTVPVSGLSVSTTYYVRAYATNTQGTAYGSSVSFTTTALENPVPVVTSITPDAAAPGQTVNVTITGANFASGATIPSMTGITVTETSRTSATTITAKFAVATGAQIGARTVKVTNPTPGGGESTTSTQFSVTLPAPSANSTKWPTGTLVSTSSTPTFDWNAVTGATNYDIQVSNQANFAKSVACELNCEENQANTFVFDYNNIPGSSTSYTVPSALPVGFQYYWRIRANTSSVKGVWSNAISFQVIAPPTSPALISPSNGATGLTGPVAFQWTPTNSTSTYQIQISTSVTFTTLYNEGTGLTSAVYTMPVFTSGNPVQYFWRVRSIGTGGTGEWSSVSFFTRAKLTSDADEGSEIPSTYSLEQNYPNPFNPSTNIRFGLPETAPVTLEVYNLQGQKVAVLLQNVTKSAGMHTLSFDASKLSSGIYVYRIMAGSTFMASQKMVLLK